MKTLLDILKDVRSKKHALGHFNISDSSQLRGIAQVAQELQVPVLIGVSEGERAFIGIKQIAALVAAYRSEGLDIFLNADHTKTIDGVQAALDAGFDEVLFDGSQLSYEENVKATQEVVRRARATGRPVLVEGELGYIGTSSTLLDDIPEGAGLERTSAEQAHAFVQATGVDMLAPSVGNIHGMLKDQPDPRLDVARVAEIAAVTRAHLVLHGASGNSAEDIAGCIRAGVSVVHINTEIRNAYRKGIEAGLAESKEVAPAKYIQKGIDALKVVVLEKMKLYTK
jgi:fructose-bisphosphate aldolase, class II